ncbi:hypothetical protein CPB86DRAFT_878774 [Serendipita vermifera]|nr:hypothetical protein CPB86DRAFT_878774 [Serendipita vermifera]
MASPSRSQLAPNHPYQVSPSTSVSTPFDESIYNKPVYNGFYLSSNYYPPPQTSPNQLSRAGIPLQTSFISYHGVLRVSVKSLAVFFLILGLCVGTFLYVFLNCSSWDSRVIQTTAPLGNVLLLVNICSKVVLICLPLVMSSAAYHIADGWTKESREPERRNLPTPYQYTLLLGLFTGANVFVVWNTAKYFSRSPVSHPALRSNEKQASPRAQASYPLKKAFATLVIALFVAYAIVAIDFSLHDFSSVVILPKHLGQINPKSAFYGRGLRVECLYPDSESGLPCTMNTEPDLLNTNYITGYQEALKIYRGSSKSNQVVLISHEDSEIVALVSPSTATLPGSSYIANTVGIQAQCISVINNCPFEEDGTLNSEGFCSIAGYPEFAVLSMNEPGGYIGRLINTSYGSGSDWLPPIMVEEISPNPYIFLFQGQFYTEPSMLQTGRGDDLVWARSQSSLMSSVAAICSATVVDLEILYQSINNSYSIKSVVPSNNNATVRAVTAVLDASQGPFQQSSQPALSLQTAALVSTSTSDPKFLRELTRTYIKSYFPFAHSAFIPIPVTTIDVTPIVEGTAIPTPWFLIYLGLLLLFGLLALSQGILAWKASREAVWRPNISPKKSSLWGSKGKKETRVNVVQLAADRLTSSVGLVHELFERSNRDERDVARSLQDSNIAMFKEGGGMDGKEQEVRIGIGLKADRVERFGFVVTPR